MSMYKWETTHNAQYMSIAWTQELHLGESLQPISEALRRRNRASEHPSNCLLQFCCTLRQLFQETFDSYFSCLKILKTLHQLDLIALIENLASPLGETWVHPGHRGNVLFPQGKLSRHLLLRKFCLCVARRGAVQGEQHPLHLKEDRVLRVENLASSLEKALETNKVCARHSIKRRGHLVHPRLRLCRRDHRVALATFPRRGRVERSFGENCPT